MSTKFWVLDPPMMVGPTAFAEPVDARYGAPPMCPVCSRPIASRPWLEPFKVRLRSGTKTDKPGDTITGPGFDGFLATPNFQSMYDAAGLTGVIDWRPVEIVNLPGAVYRLTILPDPTVRADFSQMDIQFKSSPNCSYCQQGIIERYHGVKVDEATWSGQDIFPLTNLGFLLVTDRFKAVVDQNEFTGLSLVPASEFIPSYARTRPN